MIVLLMYSFILRFFFKSEMLRIEPQTFSKTSMFYLFIKIILFYLFTDNCYFSSYILNQASFLFLHCSSNIWQLQTVARDCLSVLFLISINVVIKLISYFQFFITQWTWFLQDCLSIAASLNFGKCMLFIFSNRR